MTAPSLLEAAVAYARCGFHVFPIQPGGKAPTTPSGHLDATVDEAVIRAWWGSSPTSNIGISLEPSGLVVLDVDVAEGKPGRKSLAEFDAALPPTLAQRTGRGGLHALFLRPAGVEARRLIGFRPGLDLLGKGYIVAAPSRLDGAGGYEWVDPAATVAPLPDVLRDVQRTRTTQAVDGDRTHISEGGRNQALYRLGAALRDQGLGPAALALALERENLERCRPPLAEEEVAAVARSVLARVRPARDAATSAALVDDLVAMVRGVEAPTGDLEAEVDPSGLPQLISEAARAAGPPVRTYPTGWAELDGLLGGGVKTRQLLVLAAPPSDGKSALAIETSALLATSGLPVMYVSTELEGAELAARRAAPILGLPWTDIVGGKATPEQVEKALAGQRIYVIGCDALPMDGQAAVALIIGKAQAVAAVEGMPPAIVIDYLQDLARGGEDARQKVGQVAAQARAISQGLDCVVLAVCSVSRAYYGGGKAEALRQCEDARAYLAAAKESGDVDYAAATVIFLDVAPEGADGTRAARAAVAKCRHGRAGFAGMRFDGRVGAWRADPGACAEVLSSGERATTRRDGEDDAAVLAQCQRLWEGGNPPTRSTLTAAAGIQRQRAVNAVGRLLASGALVEGDAPHPVTHRTLRGVIRASVSRVSSGTTAPG